MQRPVGSLCVSEASRRDATSRYLAPLKTKTGRSSFPKRKQDAALFQTCATVQADARHPPRSHASRRAPVSSAAATGDHERVLGVALKRPCGNLVECAHESIHFHDLAVTGAER